MGESTIQYSYKGTVLRSFAVSVKYGGNSETHTVLTKYNYDHIGRVLSTTKNIDNLGDKTINQFTYKETGQVDTKTVGANLRNESFSYNMQGMLTAINAPYVSQTNNNNKAYFGEILSYAHGFTTNQYNGGIAGVQWKNAGDSTARAYGYAYDNVGRLTNADFTQQNSGSAAWTNDKVDYTVSGLSYDAGGNILTMQQKGLLAVGGNATIDNLSYNYFANSNRLQKVTDSSPFVVGLGDFKDSTTTADDYTYDTNGNIVKDNNRNMQGAVFNLLDKPDSMAIAGKSCTYYTYDAAGSTLCKTVKDYKTNTVKRYTYIGGFVYTSNYLIGAAPAPDSLQYAMFEEGRIRWKAPAVVGGPSTLVFDYMIKDHAGNVRTILTDEVRRDDYPMASMETTPASSSATEEAVYAGLNQTRTPKAGISGYPADNTTTPNDFVAKVQATAGSQKVGPSITLKVMKGDTVNIKVSSWYKLNGASPNTPQSPLVDIVNALISGISGSAAVNTHNVTTTQLTTNNAFTPDITQFLTNQSNSNYNTAKPKAYLNWIYFDEQFNIVSSSSGAEQVGNVQQFKLHVQQTVATKCGFLYVYVSNETPNVPVYFDNLQVSHARSPLLETNEYYPYGLKMASISYKASMTMTNRYGWNGGNEYEDEGELNYSNTFYRKYDAQIGRFTGVDMLAEKFAGINPYQFGANNPIMFNDPMGDQFGGVNGERLGQMQAHLMNDTWGYNTYGGLGGMMKGGNYSSFWDNIFGYLDFDGKIHQDNNGNWVWKGWIVSGTLDNTIASWSSEIIGRAESSYKGLEVQAVRNVEDGTFSSWYSNNSGEFDSRIEAYRAWQIDPSYHEGEGFWARTFRTIGNGTMEARRDYASGGMNMYSGWAKAAGAAEGASAYAGVREASKFLIGQGVPRATRLQIINSFEAGSISLRTADNATFGLRFYDGVNAFDKGRYLFPTFTNNISREGLALPY